MPPKSRKKKAPPPKTPDQSIEKAKQQQVHWSLKTKLTLVDGLLEVKEALGDGSNPRDVQLQHACDKVNVEHAHEQTCPKTVPACKSQVVVLRKVFTGLKGWDDKSGVSYDNEVHGCGIVDKKDEAWRAHLVAYPEIEKYANKPWGALWPKMQQLCSSVVVKGNNVYNAHATPAPDFSTASKNDDLDDSSSEGSIPHANVSGHARAPTISIDGSGDEADAEKPAEVNYSDDEIQHPQCSTCQQEQKSR